MLVLLGIQSSQAGKCFTVLGILALLESKKVEKMMINEILINILILENACFIGYSLQSSLKMLTVLGTLALLESKKVGKMMIN